MVASSDLPAPPSPEGLGRTPAWLLLLALLAIAGWRCCDEHRTLNATIDEGRHIAAAVEVWDTGRFTIYPHSPPLPRYVNGLLPWLAGARMPDETSADFAALLEKTDREHAVGMWVLEHAGEERYWDVLPAARRGTLVFLAVLLLYTYLWAGALYGRAAGVIAAGLVSFSPNVIAHSALATVDVAFAATFLAASYSLWRWVTAPTMRRWLVWCVALTAAFLCKFPAPSFVGFVAVAFAWLGRGELRAAWAACTRRRGTVLHAALALVGIGFVATWLAYQCNVRTAAEVDTYGWLQPLLDRRFPVGSSLHGAANWLAHDLLLPMAELVNAGYVLYKEATRTWTAFLLGEVSDDGFFWFFPVAIGVKSTLGLLLLALTSGVWLVVERRRAWRRGTGYVVLAGVVFLALLMSKRMNIGVRHALPFYPFLAIVSAAVFARRDGGGRAPVALLAVGGLLLVWHAVASWRSHPDELAYFNAIAGDRGHEFLRDSNLDWGQDVARLADYCEREGIEEITMYVFGSTSPEVLGLRGVRRLEPGERPSGWFAISYNNLAGITLPPEKRDEMLAAWDHFAWLPAEPTARIGESILLYRLP